MRKIWIIFVLFMLPITWNVNAQSTGVQDRMYWIDVLTRIADPVLTHMSQGKLKATMPVETLSGIENPPNARTTHLEALGRLLAGMAPWLELGPDETPEGILREKYIRLMIKSIEYGFDPGSPDYLNFETARQPLVDAAFFCEGLLRAPNQIWGNLSAKTKQDVVNAMEKTRKIKPSETNWLLFSATIEAALLELTGQWNAEPVEYALTRFKEWYKGDAWYGDGEKFHLDYYNSFVIHPMMMDVLIVMQKHDKGEEEMYKLETKRFIRFAEQLERFISPDGTYPAVGRSIAYRFGAFHQLSQAALLNLLPASITKAQVRCALTAVIQKHMRVDGNFDKDGWLTLGFCGHQPEISERYISTGSLYLCTAVFLALGLPSTDEFWCGPYTEWTGKRIWSGKTDVKADKSINN